MFQKKVGWRLTWKSTSGVTKAEIDYILTNKPDIVTEVTVINQVNIGSDPQNGYEQRQTGGRGGKEITDDQEASKSRYHRHMISEDRIRTTRVNLLQET